MNDCLNPRLLKERQLCKGRVEIVELRVDERSRLCNVALSELNRVIKCRVLVCAVLRRGDVVAPDGSFVLREGDRIFVTASTESLATLLDNLGIITKKGQSCYDLRRRTCKLLSCSAA